MATYLRALGWLLCTLGVAATIYCTDAVLADAAYYHAALAMEKYPGNVLYTTEFKMAEPRHMLLVAGAASAAPLGVILGSICLGISRVLRSLGQPR
ncbi:MAG: hypothetical protein HY899_05575 [Deltaproteobacteria bacterium]|nr:hypothetical protein [Deltaproteobacteria bacterium]